MEKKDLLGVRTKPAAGKRRRKVAAGPGLAKAIAEYLASDSYMYAPLVSEPQEPAPPQPAAAPATSTPASAEKGVALVQKYRGSWRGTFAAC
ncbi:uncharacterized protein LOC119367851 [Triticum dicoccoides]|uniref:uncharacterized protein LOC119367851 n=1 Tax=Triticum dicoccoides TaxID=85692 RepID=UPI00188E235A|nr:uncharacterized protein LOC119367851 [Triticum dicoccoides]